MYANKHIVYTRFPGIFKDFNIIHTLFHLLVNKRQNAFVEKYQLLHPIDRLLLTPREVLNMLITVYEKSKKKKS